MLENNEERGRLVFKYLSYEGILVRLELLMNEEQLINGSHFPLLKTRSLTVLNS